MYNFTSYHIYLNIFHSAKTETESYSIRLLLWARWKIRVTLECTWTHTCTRVKSSLITFFGIYLGDVMQCDVKNLEMQRPIQDQMPKQGEAKLFIKLCSIWRWISRAGTMGKKMLSRLIIVIITSSENMHFTYIFSHIIE